MTVDPVADLRSLGEAGFADDRWRPIATGTFANRPSVSLMRANAFYYATDTGTLYYSDGVSWVGAASSAPTVGTSLPASPTDGMEAILVDSLTSPTYVWRFRYMSSISDAFKWLFVGGYSRYQRDDTSNSTASTTYVDFANPVSFTVPRAGLYEVEHGCNDQFRSIIVSPKMGTAATSDTDGIGESSGGNLPGWFHRIVRTGSLSASDVIKLQFRTTDGVSRSILGKYMTVQPLRVS